MLLCPKCGYDNELGRIFCHQCGQKLDLDAIKPPSRGGKSLKKKSYTTLWVWLWRLVALAVVGAVGWVLYLIFQLPPVPATPSDAEIRAADKKWMALEKLTMKRKPDVIEVTPAELKAFLAGLQFEKKNIPWGIVPSQLWADPQAGGVNVSILGMMKFGGFFERQIYLSYTVAPKLGDGKLAFEPLEGTVGSLKWPLPVVKGLGFHQQIFGQVFGRLKMEQTTLAEFNAIELQKDRIVFQFQPR